MNHPVSSSFGRLVLVTDRTFKASGVSSLESPMVSVINKSFHGSTTSLGRLAGRSLPVGQFIASFTHLVGNHLPIC